MGPRFEGLAYTAQGLQPRTPDSHSQHLSRRGPITQIVELKVPNTSICMIEGLVHLKHACILKPLGLHDPDLCNPERTPPPPPHNTTRFGVPINRIPSEPLNSLLLYANAKVL